LIFLAKRNKSNAEKTSLQQPGVRLFICAFEAETFGRLVCVVDDGDVAPVVDDREANFFAGAVDFEWQNRPLSIGHLLELGGAGRSPSAVLVVKNKSVLFDRMLLRRIVEVIEDCDRRFDPEGWLAACAEGIDQHGAIRSAIYGLEEPAFFWGRYPAPVVSMSSDAYLVNLSAVRHCGLKPPDDARRFECALVEDGYCTGLVSVFHPRFALPVREKMKDSEGLAGAPLAARYTEKAIDGFISAVAGATAPMSVSIVTRTLFNRPVLLKRLLTSITRAKIDQIEIEVVLASDCPDAADNFAVIADQHRRTPIRLVQTPPGEEPSRNRNLKAGVAAAKHDYIWIIDDDDYVDIFAFDILKLVTFGGAKPLIFAACDVHEENWTPRKGGDAVLSSTRRLRDYPATGWRDMFIGYNRIPICGCLAPREFLQARLSSLALPNDLSEDYAIFLDMLTSPDLPEIAEIGKPLSHISQRAEGENTMAMADRTPWVQCITSYLSDLSYSGRNPGAYQLLAALGKPKREAQH